MKYYLAKVNGAPFVESTQIDAKGKDPNFERFDIPTDHDGLKAFAQDLLNQIHALRTSDPIAAHGGAPEQEAAAPSPPPPASPPVREPSYSEVSVKIDEVWDTLPLARQLDFAQMAMERARWAIKPAKTEEAA